MTPPVQLKAAIYGFSGVPENLNESVFKTGTFGRSVTPPCSNSIQQYSGEEALVYSCLIRSIPRKYGRKASGMITDPSACW